MKPFPDAFLEIAENSSSEEGYTFLSDNGKREDFFSFKEIANKAKVLASSLQREGINSGDKIILILPDNRDFIFLFLAISFLRAVPVPVTPPFNLKQMPEYLKYLEYVLEISKAKSIFTSEEIKPFLGSLLGPSLMQIKIPSELKTNISDKSLDTLITPNPDDIALIQFTSGSTKRPKGVCILHKNLMANIQGLREGLKLQKQDRFCSWLPLYHDMGLIGFFLTPMAIGISGLIIPPLYFLKRPNIWLQKMSETRSAISYAPNFAYGLCTKRVSDSDLNEADLSAWRVAGCGAEPIQAETLNAFATKFKKYGFNANSFVPSYGMAENTLAITLTKLNQNLKVESVNYEILTTQKCAVVSHDESQNVINLVSCGSCIPGHDLQIISPEGGNLPERHVGEIAIKGPSLMQGYFENFEANQEAFIDGWFRTGDLGYIADNELFVCGRVKDLIIVSGKNYYPADLEVLASEIAGVRKGNVVAFGLQDFGTQEKVVICAETSLPETQHKELKEKIRTTIINGLGIKVDEIVLLESGSLPKTSSGKLQRLKTKDLFIKGELQSAKGKAKCLKNALRIGKIWASSKYQFFLTGLKK